MFKCDCHSYNWEIGTVPEVILPTPEWSNKPNGVCVDACIAELVRALWKADVQTIGSCCGHGREDATIILAEDSMDQIDTASEVIHDFGRNVKIKLWRLVTVR